MNTNEGKNETKGTEKTDSVPAVETQGTSETVGVNRKPMLELLNALNRAAEMLEATGGAAPLVTQSAEGPAQVRPLRVYVASSWRNGNQQEAVKRLRNAGCEVYDFKNPAPEIVGFSWGQIDKSYRTWSAPDFREALAHPIAQRGYGYDFAAMKWADVCLLLLPCGRSAHLEAGWFAGMGKRLIVLLDPSFEPELMYKLTEWVCVTWEEVLKALKDPLVTWTEGRYWPEAACLPTRRTPWTGEDKAPALAPKSKDGTQEAEKTDEKPQVKQAPECTCFRCQDGQTPLYCLNCAEVLLMADKRQRLLPGVGVKGTTDEHGPARTNTPGAAKRFLDLGNGERISMDQVVAYRVDECAPPCVAFVMANKDWKSTYAPRGTDTKAAMEWLDELFGARPLWK